MNWPCIRQGLGRCRPLAFLYIRGATLGSGKLPPILPGKTSTLTPWCATSTPPALTHASRKEISLPLHRRLCGGE